MQSLKRYKRECRLSAMVGLTLPPKAFLWVDAHGFYHRI